MRNWIRIEDSSGTAVGEGPVVSSTGWRSRARLDRAGTMQFDMALTDARAVHVTAKRVARCQSILNTVVTDLGAGIVDRTVVDVNQRGELGLTIEGDDLMRELTYRQVGDLLISDGAGGPDNEGPGDIMAFAPSGWSLDTDEGFETTAKDILHQFAGETVLQALIRLAELTGEHFRLGTGRSIVWMRKYGSAKVIVDSYTGVFTPPETVTGATSGATGTLIEYYDTLTDKWLYIEDVSGVFQGEDITGGSSGATASTLGTIYQPASGVRAVRGGDPARVADNTYICIITDLQEVKDTYSSCVGRLYAYGVGNGDAKIDLSTTSTALAGWTVGNDSKGYYLQHTATWNAYGIEGRREWKDIEAADTLLEAAYEWMSRQLVAQSFYKLSVGKLDRVLHCGQTIHVLYRKNVDGYQALDIDRDLLILEIETEVDDKGLRTAGLTVATIDRWPEDDSSAVVGQAGTNQDYYQHDQPVDSGAISAFDTLTVNQWAVINESGADADSRIEGDTDPNLIYVDAGNNRVGIGTAAPGVKLDVNGTLASNGRQAAVTTKTANYTATATDEVVVCNSSSAFTITLPAASGSGQVLIVKNINTGTITVDGNSSDTIDGATTVNIIQWEAVQLVDYVANKWVIV